MTLKAQAYVTSLLQHAFVLDTGARGATTTFVQRGLGDVLLVGKRGLSVARGTRPGPVRDRHPELLDPCRPPVVVDGNVDKKGRRKVAGAYLTTSIRRGPEDRGQAIITARSSLEAADPADIARFPRADAHDRRFRR